MSQGGEDIDDSDNEKNGMSGNTNISKKFQSFITPKAESSDLIIKYQINDQPVTNHVIVSTQSKLSLSQILEKDNSSFGSETIDEIRIKNIKFQSYVKTDMAKGINLLFAGVKQNEINLIVKTK